MFVVVVFVSAVVVVVDCACTGAVVWLSDCFDVFVMWLFGYVVI